MKGPTICLLLALGSWRFLQPVVAQATEPIDLAAALAGDGLHLVGGDWRVESRTLHQPATRGGAHAFVHRTAYTDVALSFEFLVHDQGSGVRAAGALVRSTDSETFYGVHFDTRNDQAVLFVSPWKDLPDWIVLARRTVTLDPKRWYAARFEATEKRLSVSLDGQPLFEAEDDRYAAGVVGLYTSEGSASFKDIRLDGTPTMLPKDWCDVTPPQRYQIVASGEAAGGYAAFPDVCRTASGELLCVFYSGYGHISTPSETWPRGGRVMAVRSGNQGQTWGEPFILADTVHDDRDPHVAALGDGSLVCNWFVASNPARPLPGDRPVGLFLARSDDGGKTWSQPEEIAIESADWFASSAPIRELPDGTWILGLYTENPAANRVFGATIRSGDRGRTWGDLAPIGEHSGLYLDAETDVVPLADGTLLAALRSSKTELHFATSMDDGRTWSDVRTAGFPGHCPHFLRHSSGTILLAHRIPATALHWSRDEGRTWEGPFELDRVGGAYPSCVELSDGRVYCVYYEEGDGSSLRGLTLRVGPKGPTFDQGAAATPGQAPVRFSEHLIADKYDYAYGLAAVDLDSDGDLDLTSVDIRGKSEAADRQLSSLFWFENDGQGIFQKHVIHQGEPGWLERHAAGDISGDGKPDVAVVNNREDNIGNLVWFANCDQPSTGLWQRYVITTKCPRAYDVVLNDLDGDGDLDAAASGYTSGRFTWYENPGQDGWDREWPQYQIDENMPETRTIRAGDFNGDGRVDLLGAAVGHANIPPDVTDVRVHGSSIVWYENSGQPTSQPWKKHVIDDTSRAPIHGHPVDLDGDGDLDVVMAFGIWDVLVPEDMHEVAWYENVGNPGTALEWKKVKIGDLPNAFEAVAADLDDDGDLDIVATSWARGDRVVWFENRSDPRDKWTMHVLKENFYAANQVIVADFNGDQRPDIAATADAGSRRVDGANELRWWRNEGPADAE